MASSRACRRLAAVGSHLAAAEEPVPAKGKNLQAPGKKGEGDHASNQSVSVSTVTAVQRFQMDTKGWLVLPGVLSPSECDAIKEHMYGGGDTYSGPCAMLLDHPVHTLYAPPPQLDSRTDL